MSPGREFCPCRGPVTTPQLSPVLIPDFSPLYGLTTSLSLKMPDTAVAPPAPLPRPGPGSGIGQLLRDPDHYEEINVIGNGKTGLFSRYSQIYFS